MLSAQSVIIDSVQHTTDMPLGFIISDDGRTLLAVTERDDGVLEFMTVPVTLMQQSNEVSVPCIKANDGNININPVDLSSIDVLRGLEIPTTVDTHPVNASDSESPWHELCQSKQPPNIEGSVIKRSPGRPRKDGTTPPSNSTNSLKCDICGQGFSRQMLYRKHMQHHAEEKPHRCPKCPASFNVPSNFTLHMATHITGEPKCPECGKKFARMASLKSHMLLHEKEESLFCTECEDAFTTKAQLDAHLKLHNEKWSTEDVRKCKLCSRQFKQPALYRLHIREHYRLQTKVVKHTKKGMKHKTMYKCKICLKSFQKPSQLVRHIRIHTKEKPFQCNLCTRAFTQKGSLKIHMWKHNGYRPHVCTNCNARFSQKGNLNAHIRRVHSTSDGEPLYGCTNCSCFFKKLGSLNTHMRKVHANPVEVKTENNSTTDADMRATVDTVMSQLAALESITRNPADSTANNQSKNDILQQALKNSGLSSKEKNANTGLIPSKKVEPHTKFVTLLDSSADGTMRKYVTIKQRSIGNIRWYTCSYCYKEFKKPSDLIRHIRVHTQEKPFKCSFCSRSFAMNSTMIIHERTHTGTKKYSCKTCDKVFACHSSLTAHMRLHTKPHKCDVCGKLFSSSTILKSHMRTHAKGNEKLSPEAEILAPQIVLEEPLLISDAGNKISIAQIQSKNQQSHQNNDVTRPHKCWMCPAAFRKINYLKQHYRRHTGERPYKCQICDSRFTSNSILKSHLHTHETSRPYSCSTCGAKFSTQSSMKRHLITHSNKRPFMCPYCHKTFKTSVNCRKHMKRHKTELAQKQLEQQRTQQQEQQQSQPHLVETTGESGLPGNIMLTDEMDVTFQPQMAPDFTQAFSDQFQTITVDKDKTFLPQNDTTPTIVNHDLPAIAPMNLGSSQTLHADETGTITLPNYSGDQTLTAESIREIEETLNQQLFNIGMNLGLGGNLTRPMNETTSSSLVSREQPELNIIYNDGKSLETSTNSTMSTGIFPPQFDTFDMSQITLQTDNEMDIGISSANSTSMASILPKSAQEEQHLVAVTASTEDSHTKPSRHLMVISSIQTCPELLRPVQACPKYPKVIAKADTTDGMDIQYIGEIREQNETNLGTADVPNPLPYHCDQCEECFSEEVHLNVHKKSHLPPEIVALNTDEVSITNPDCLLQCHMCIKKGFTAAALKEHLKTHRGRKEFQCTECPLKFCTNGGLSRHLKMHTSKIKLKCDNCDTKFRSKIHMKCHEKTCNSDSNRSSVEPDSSQKESSLTNTNGIILPDERGGNISSLSEEVFPNVPDTKTSEKKEYTNKCEYCPKTFRKPSDLVRHVRTHTGERPYKCDYCKKSFAVKCTLDCHMKVHTGKEAFPCHVCNSLFATKGSLKVHMRLHTGSKPFKCPSCDLRFRTSGHRKVHLLTHMREQKGVMKRKPRQHKGSAIAEVAAELEKTVANAATPETNQTQNNEYANLDSITIDTSGLANHITFNADGTILNNNSMLSVNESTQLVADLHFLLANGLVTIQTDDNILQQLPNETSVVSSEASASELMTTESLTTATCTDTKPHRIIIETTTPPGIVVQSDRALQNDNCAEMVDTIGINQLVKAIESNDKYAPETVQSKKECDICGKAFMKPCQVERHKRIHTGERPYKCTLCSKSFAQKPTLQMHQKHHTGDRPHPCPHCNYSSTQKINLQTHLKRVHHLDNLDKTTVRRGQQVLSAKVTQENLDDTRILSLDDISFVDFLK